VAEGRLAIAGAVALLAACRGHHEEGPPALGKALDALLTAADRAHAPWRCSALDPAALTRLVTGDWTLEEHTLSTKKSELKIGVVADAGGSAPATIAALARLRGKLDGIDLLVTLGGMGTTKAELEATLGTLAGKEPLVVLAGDLEDERDQQAALATLRAKGTLVLDARQARWITGDGIAIATIPGTGAVDRLVAGLDGCMWRAAEVAAIYDDLAHRPGMRVALLAEPPRTGATGEVALAPTGAVDVVVHGTGAVTPPRQGVRDGKKADLSPGTSDASPRLPQTRLPSAGLLVIRGGSWSWRPLLDER
jgi:hypothetical protein